MLTPADRSAKYKVIEKTRMLRVENMRKLVGVLGSWEALSRQTGKARANLIAMAGPNPRRAIGEAIAREIEYVLKLSPGWLDEVH